MIPVVSVPATIADVPFYSQFADISSVTWKKQGCGVASVAMVVDYYSTEPVSVNKMLTQAIASGAYLKSAGWTHKGLVQLAQKYGLDGKSYDLTSSSSKVAFAAFKAQLLTGPVIASVHYKFDPKSTIPHLVVIDGIDKDFVYYNDPAADGGKKKISTAVFLKAWKQKFIVIRPLKEPAKVALLESTSVNFFSRFFSRSAGDQFKNGNAA